MLLDLWALFPYKRSGDDAGGGWVKEKKRKIVNDYADNEKKRKLAIIEEIAPSNITKVQSDEELVKVKRLIAKLDEQDDEEVLMLLL